jgi:hypothetical protein
VNVRNIFALLFVAAFLLLFFIVLIPVPILWPDIPPAITISAGAKLWNDRTFEVILQGFIILTGIMAILLLVFGIKMGGPDD